MSHAQPITRQAINLLIGHTLTALRKTQRHGAKHKVRKALRALHVARQWVDRNPHIAWLYVNAALSSIRCALLIRA